MPANKILPDSPALIACLCVFLASFGIFWYSPVHQLSDSNYSMLLSQSLLDHRSFLLDEYAVPRLAPEYHDHTWKNGYIHQIELVNKHLYYYMPPGSSVLSVPFVAVMNAFGVSAVNPDGTYNAAGEVKIETCLAALLMGMLSVTFFLMCRLMLPLRWSLVVTFGGSLGTQVWSTASRALWADTWGMLLVGIAVYMLLSQEAGEFRIRPILLATLLSWAYFVRPTNAVPILAISVYIVLFFRKIFFAYAVTGASWFLGFVFYSWSHFRLILPHYFMVSRLSFGSFPVAVAGNLISPSRGLLIYVPVLLFLVYLLIRYWKQMIHRRLVLLALSVSGGFLIVISGFEPWWAGASFGSRYTAPLVSWFVLLAVIVINAMLRDVQSTQAGSLRSGKIQYVVGGLLLMLSVGINAVGAVSETAWWWNSLGNIDHDANKVWDWRYPQLLAPFIHPPLPAEFPLAHGRLDFSSPESERFLWYGWSGPEAGFRWTDGREAAILFATDPIADVVFQMRLTPFLIAGQHEKQRVEIDLNGRRLEAMELRYGSPELYKLELAGSLLTQRNVLTFRLPDAASPEQFKVNADPRQLAIAVHWISFEPRNKKES
jgi:hypothetical protein